MQPGEYITLVGGKLGNICDQLNFRTSTGRVFAGGGQGGSQMNCDTGRATQPYVLAVEAGFGGHVHHLKCFYLDLAQNPGLAAQVQS